LILTAHTSLSSSQTKKEKNFKISKLKNIAELVSTSLIEALITGMQITHENGKVSNTYYSGLNSTKFPEGYEDPAYSKALPAGEIPDYGGPYGGDSSTIYESNWDIWQRWMSDITTKIVRRSYLELISDSLLTHL
jgi:hypothetical protein